MKKFSARKWFFSTAISLGSFLLFFLIFNLLVDPFGLYRVLCIEGFNSNKYEATKHTRVAKFYKIENLKPKAIVLGTSRAEIGIDPEHRGWSQDAKPVYNLAIGGATATEVLKYLEFLCLHDPPAQVVLGLDFFMFNAYQNKSDLSEPLSYSESKKFFETLFSIDVIKASFRTLLAQDAIEFPGYLDNGQIVWTYDLDKISRYGHREAFVRNVRKYLGHHYFPPPEKKFALIDPLSGQSTLDVFRKIVALSRDHEIDLRLFISPIHVWQSLTIEKAGLWGDYETWKRGIVKVLADENNKIKNKVPYLMWDFSDLSAYTTEALPAYGDNVSFMNFYWESSHYKKELGDLVLDRVFGQDKSPLNNNEFFGELIDAENIDEHLRGIRNDLESYRNEHPQEVEQIENVFQEFQYLP